MENAHIVPFEDKEIRKIWQDEQWYFSIVDVISALSNSKNPNVYWGSLKSENLSY
jgi:prophage antirepressor-like protein